MSKINRLPQKNKGLMMNDLAIDEMPMIDDLNVAVPLNIAEEAARAGGNIIRERFGETLGMRLKHDIEVQTPVDVEAERVIISFIERYYLNHGIIGEESNPKRGDSPFTWVIDPMDGTSNFVLNIPQVAVCVSLKKGDDVLLTVIHQPMIDVTYTAMRGAGAYVNGKLIQLQPRDVPLAKSTICSILTYAMHDNPLIYSVINKLYESTRRLLDTWTPSLDWCMLATGKIDALVYFSDERLWIDPGMLAGAFFFHEAGGLISNLNGDITTEMTQLTSVIAAPTSSMIEQVSHLILYEPLVKKLSG